MLVYEIAHNRDFGRFVRCAITLLALWVRYPLENGKRRRSPVPDLLIRDLEPDTIERLKNQAADNGRSMQAEAKAIIEDGTRLSMQEWLVQARATAARIAAKYPEGTGPGAVETIRAAREERERHWDRLFPDTRRSSDDEAYEADE